MINMIINFNSPSLQSLVFESYVHVDIMINSHMLCITFLDIYDVIDK